MNVVGVAAQLGDLLKLRQVPEPNRVVAAGRRQPRVVGAERQPINRAAVNQRGQGFKCRGVPNAQRSCRGRRTQSGRRRC